VCWEDSRDGQWDVLDFLDEGEVGNECIEIGSVGSNISEEVQRFMLKVMELVTSDSEEGIEEEACQWGRNVVVEERRCQGENVLTWEECVLDGGGGGIDVGLVN